MRFLVDASSDARLVPYLRALGHVVTRIGTDYPADLADRDVLATACAEQRILVTDDRDFGQLVVQDRAPHQGVIYLRLASTELAIRIACIATVLAAYPDGVTEFLVVTEERIRPRWPRDRKSGLPRKPQRMESHVGRARPRLVPPPPGLRLLPARSKKQPGALPSLPAA